MAVRVVRCRLRERMKAIKAIVERHLPEHWLIDHGDELRVLTPTGRVDMVVTLYPNVDGVVVDVYEKSLEETALAVGREIEETLGVRVTCYLRW